MSFKALPASLINLSLALLLWAPCLPHRAAAQKPAPPQLPAYRLGTQVVPTAQSVRLRIDPDKPDYSGAVRIDLAVRQPVTSFRFHAVADMKFDKLVLSGPKGPLRTTQSRDGAMVTLTAAQPLQPGPHTLTIDFTHALGVRAVGLYRMVQDHRGYAFTQFESADARKAFPCWDEPAFKIPYQITVEIPRDQAGVSNTPIENESVAGPWKTLVFKRTPPLPSYLLALAVGPLEFVPLPDLGVPGRIVTTKGQSRLAGLAPKMTGPILRALERYFGRKYPYEKLDFIAIPEYWPGAMENPGAITFADGILLIDDKASPAHQRTLALVTAHELAHMWFGDLVTMAWWDDLWLNESFADWMGQKITAELYPQFHLEVTDADAVQDVMKIDSRLTTEAIRQEVTNADNVLTRVGLNYDKGRAVLGMFEQWMGPENFRQGIIEYMRAHAEGNATAADLWAAMAQVRSGGTSGSQLAAAMATFVDQPGLPLINVALLPGGKVRLSQRRYTTSGVTAKAELWQVPVALKYGAGGAAEKQTVLLTAATQDFTLKGTPKWVFPLAHATGYYRFSLSKDGLRDLSARATAVLDPAERVALLGDLEALLDAGEVSGEDFLQILQRAGDDPDPQVVSALLSGLERVRLTFVTEKLQQPFAAYVQRVLAPAARRFGLTRKAGEDQRVTLFRPDLLHWLGEEGDQEVLRLAREAAAAYGRDPAAADQSVIGVMLRLSALHGDRALFDDYRRRFEAAQDPTVRVRYLTTLGRFRAPGLADAALAYALGDPVRPTELLDVPFSMMDTPAGRDRVYAWFTKNFQVITGRIPEFILSEMPRVAGGCEQDRLAAAKAFFAQQGHHVDGTQHTLDKVSEAVQQCAALRLREGQTVARYLSKR